MFWGNAIVYAKELGKYCFPLFSYLGVTAVTYYTQATYKEICRHENLPKWNK